MAADSSQSEVFIGLESEELREVVERRLGHPVLLQCGTSAVGQAYAVAVTQELSTAHYTDEVEQAEEAHPEVFFHEDLIKYVYKQSDTDNYGDTSSKRAAPEVSFAPASTSSDPFHSQHISIIAHEETFSKPSTSEADVQPSPFESQIDLFDVLQSFYTENDEIDTERIDADFPEMAIIPSPLASSSQNRPLAPIPEQSPQSHSAVKRNDSDSSYRLRLIAALPRRWYRPALHAHVIDSSIHRTKKECQTAVRKHHERMKKEPKIQRTKATQEDLVTLHDVPQWNGNRINTYLQRGDVISRLEQNGIGAAFGFMHTAVYLGNRQVAHFAKDSSEITSSGRLRIDPLASFVDFDGQPLKIIEYNEPHNTLEAVARAAEEFVRQKSGITFENSQHFCALCSTGEKSSFQATTHSSPGSWRIFHPSRWFGGG